MLAVNVETTKKGLGGAIVIATILVTMAKIVFKIANKVAEPLFSRNLNDNRQNERSSSSNWNSDIV